MNSNIRYFKAAKVAALVMTALCLGSINLSAQDLGVSSRSSAEVDWKIRKGLHLNAGYELRTKTSLAGIERHQVSVGIGKILCVNTVGDNEELNEMIQPIVGVLLITHDLIDCLADVNATAL